MKLINCEQVGEDYVFGQAGGELIFELAPAADSQFFAFDFENKNDFAARLEIHFYHDLKARPGFSITTGVLPHIATTVEIPLSYLDGQNLFGARRKGILKTVANGTRMALADIHYVGIHMAKCHIEPTLKIANARFAVAAVPASDFSFDSLIDEFGQQKNADWPGKTHDLAELSVYLNGELNKAQVFLADYQDNFYGAGEASYEASGNYRLEKVGNDLTNRNSESGKSADKWQMITPDGRAFWGFGCDVVEPQVTGVLEKEPEHEFALANLEKVWGDKAYDNWCLLTKYRLIKWGITTVAAWSDLKFASQAKLPYVKIFEDFPWTKAKIYRDFPDVFSEEYRQRAEKYASELAPYKDDPYLVGYFMANEPNWAFVWGLNLGYELFTGPKTLVSKPELVGWLKQKFDNIDELNKLFQTNFAHFKEILDAGPETKISKKGLKFLDKFSKVLIHEFIRVPALALRAIDAKHLNLGLRYAFISSDALFSGSEYFDIFSINCYDNSAIKNIEHVYEKTGLPVMIGEFHFGALDRGLPATGIRGVASQKDRGKAIAAYLDGAISTGHCVGAHYFCLYDQPYLGRFDGENYNIGLLDICNREYTEVTDLMQPIARIPEIFF